MNAGDAGDLSPVGSSLRTKRRERKPRAVISDLYRKRVERMFDCYCETVDQEMYRRPETWTPAFSRRFAQMADRLGSLKREGARPV
jgi:hypothetical protein